MVGPREYNHEDIIYRDISYIFSLNHKGIDHFF
jgi:hypothetical protein